MKPKIFIGSTVEGLELAKAVQLNLEHSAYTTIWFQGIFSLSSNTLDDLLSSLDEYDYGIFIFQPDDKSLIRNEEYNAIRDNVIFELGLYFGRLGKGNAFYLIPRNYKKLHLPTDLGGVTAGTYDFERLQKDKKNIRAIVGPFCTEVENIITKADLSNKGIGIKKAAMFNNFTEDFEVLIKNSNTIALFFIHSRQWRENNQNAINDFLKKDNSKLLVLLPNFLNANLMERIKNNFSDGKVIETLVKDAFTFFLELKVQFKNKIDIRHFDTYPTYSFYCFDNEAIIALYPTTSKKKNVPSFRVQQNSKFWYFLEDDLNELKKQSKKVSKEIINNLKLK